MELYSSQIIRLVMSPSRLIQRHKIKAPKYICVRAWTPHYEWLSYTEPNLSAFLPDVTLCILMGDSSSALEKKVEGIKEVK